MRIFVTGASGWIGSAVVPELLGAGHRVAGLARSDGSAAALTAAGAEVVPGTLDDLDVLGRARRRLGRRRPPRLQARARLFGGLRGGRRRRPRRRGHLRRRAGRIGQAVRPRVGGAGALDRARWPPRRTATIPTSPTRAAPGGRSTRHATALATVALASKDVRSSVVRLSPTVHGDGDTGFMAHIVALAEATGVSGYVGDGAIRWPAVHRLDAARLFRLAVERAPAGSTLHGVAEEGVTGGDIATAIGTHLGLPVDARSRPTTSSGWGFLGMDSPVSSARHPRAARLAADRPRAARRPRRRTTTTAAGRG